MRIRALALALAMGATAFGGVAAGDEPVTVYFQMEGPCNESPPRVLTLKQTPDYSGPCFPVDAGTAGPAVTAEETYTGSKKDFAFAVEAGAAVSGQFTFRDFGTQVFGAGASVGRMDFDLVITASINRKSVVIAELSEANRIMTGGPTVFEFTGEFPTGGALTGMTAQVVASGNTALSMGFDHENSFFTIG